MFDFELIFDFACPETFYKAKIFMTLKFPYATFFLGQDPHLKKLAHVMFSGL